MAYVFDLPIPGRMKLTMKNENTVRLEFSHPEELFEFVENLGDLEIHILMALGYAKKEL